MKAKTVLIMFVFLLIGLAFNAAAATRILQAEWDPVELDPKKPEVIGYRLFMKTGGAAYDYTAPVKEVKGRETTQAQVTVTCPDLTVCEYAFVVRTFSLENVESVDSNEAPKKLDLRRPDPPKNLWVRFWEAVAEFFKGIFSDNLQVKTIS